MFLVYRDQKCAISEGVEGTARTVAPTGYIRFVTPQRASYYVLITNVVKKDDPARFELLVEDAVFPVEYGDSIHCDDDVAFSLLTSQTYKP